jgi:hypothetical protein
MTDFFEFLKDLETSSPMAGPTEGRLFDRALRDRGFKAVILACLFLSILIQMLVAGWFYAKLRILENRFSTYPVIKPVKVDGHVLIPELVEIDQSIDRLTQQWHKTLEIQHALSFSEENIQAQLPSTPARERAKPRRANQVVVVEEVTN